MQKEESMNAVLEQISKIGIVPVVKIDRVEDAVPLARALCAGGLPCAEVTFRTEAAAGAIKAMVDNFPNMCVGAGTVLNAAQVDAAVEAGAKFIVSPGLNPKTVQYCLDKKVPITPGTSSPSDIEQAIELGLEVVKFFPAEQSGGLAKIKAMAAPYVNMKFMPTGGINAKNLNTYLDFPKIIACGGSWMVPGDLINEGAWDQIEKLTREAVQTMLGLEIAHVGINAESEEEAMKAQESAKALFASGVAADMPTSILTAEDFTEGSIDILTVLVKSGLVPSKSEARRAVEQGGVTVDGEKVADIKTVYAQSSFAAEGKVIKRGKKNFRKVIFQ